MARKYSQRSLTNLEGIHPDLRRVIDRALQDSPLDFIVIEGLRTRERQEYLVKRGDSRTLNSRHLTGHAVDLWPIDPATGRGPDGNNQALLWKLYNQIGPAVEDAARELGVSIVWGGRWTSFRDGPHFELERHAYPAAGDVAAQHRATPAESRTVQATAVQAAAVVPVVGAAVAGLDGTAQIVAVVGALIILAAGAVIFRERLKAWAAGWR